MPKEIITMEYQNWVAEAKFKDSKEHQEYVSRADEDLLQFVIYPMFYRQYDLNGDNLYRTHSPFPLVLKKKNDVKHPIFVIDNQYFTIVFAKFMDYYEDEECWQVSFRIKDHNFCDKKIKEYKEWYCRHYDRIFTYLTDMPKRFVYDRLDFYDGNPKRQKNFCIEFKNYGKDCMLFKFMDLFRLF